MRLVAGADFGTLSVRVTLLDSEKGCLATASANYPLNRKRDDPDFATQAHADHLASLAKAMREVLEEDRCRWQQHRSAGARYDGFQCCDC